jgi:hypothetical protein
MVGDMGKVKIGSKNGNGILDGKAFGFLFKQ